MRRADRIVQASPEDGRWSVRKKAEGRGLLCRQPAHGSRQWHSRRNLTAHAWLRESRRREYLQIGLKRCMRPGLSSPTSLLLWLGDCSIEKISKLDESCIFKSEIRNFKM